MTQRQSNVLVGSNQNGTQQNEVVFVRYPEVPFEGYRFVLGRLFWMSAMITFRQTLFILLAIAVVPTYGQQLTSDELNFFEAKIRPVLVRECYGCHSNQSGNVRGGLRLDTREVMLIGGSSGGKQMVKKRQI